MHLIVCGSYIVCEKDYTLKSLQVIFFPFLNLTSNSLKYYVQLLQDLCQNNKLYYTSFEQKILQCANLPVENN